MHYTTVEEVALFLNIDVTTLTAMEQGQISNLITYMDSVIDNYCGYTLGAADYTDKRFNGSGTSTLDLNVYTVNSITSVREKNADGTFTDHTANIEILDDGIIQFTTTSGLTFTSGALNWYASFNAGLSPIPADIAFAATYLVSIHFSKISQFLIGVSEQGATGITTTYDSIELPVPVKRVLDRYRKISIF